MAVKSRPAVLFLDTRFSAVAQSVAQAGFEVAVERPDAEPQMPLMCGLGRARETMALRRAYAIGRRYAGQGFDAVIAPLEGGVAHGLLMQRATGEMPRSTAIALWCERPTRWEVLTADAAPQDLAPLVADALERTCVGLADQLIVPSTATLERLKGLGVRLPPVGVATLPSPAELRDIDPQGAIEDITFVGPLSRRYGALAFMDAIETLAARGQLSGRTVTFLGPMADASAAQMKVILGLRATAWPFRFRLLDRESRDVLGELSAPNRLPVFAASEVGDEWGYQALLESGRAVVRAADADALVAAISMALEGGPVPSSAPPEPTDWPEIIRALIASRQAPHPQPPSGKASVCVVHRDRGAELARALHSITAAAVDTVCETIVVDNASDRPPRLPGGVRRLRLDAPRTQQQALNMAANAAASDVLVFLDDDNTFAPTGIDRLVRALAEGPFDVVVSTLDIVDGDPSTGFSAGRFLFLGDAGMAGLFFNGFGDTAMAVKRDAFLRIGGFVELGYQSSALDWVFLAKARAHGLQIGVLIEPAIRYARRLGNERHQWRKLDVEGARRTVLEMYGDTIDAPLMSRLAQGLAGALFAG